MEREIRGHTKVGYWLWITILLVATLIQFISQEGVLGIYYPIFSFHPENVWIYVLLFAICFDLSGNSTFI